MTLLFELLFFRSVKIEKKEKKDREKPINKIIFAQQNSFN